MELACHETTCSMVQIPSSASCWFFFTRNLCLEQSWERGSCNALKSWKRAPFLSPLSARARRMSSDMMDVSIREKGRRVKKKFFLLKSDCGLRHIAYRGIGWNAHIQMRQCSSRNKHHIDLLQCPECIYCSDAPLYILHLLVHSQCQILCCSSLVPNCGPCKQFVD